MERCTPSPEGVTVFYFLAGVRGWIAEQQAGIKQFRRRKDEELECVHAVFAAASSGIDETVAPSWNAPRP
ncbi:MAG: hypothetical protein WAN46_04420 [Gammaproteobacteria bacterium]